METDTKSIRRVLVAALAMGVALLAAACGSSPTATPFVPTPPADGEVASIALTSSAFQAGQPIPALYTCDSDNLSPALAWARSPRETVSYALIVDDPDTPGRVFTHWVLFNLPGATSSLAKNVPTDERLDSGALQGRNDFGKTGYRGPCPPGGSPHRYRFFLYALDTTLSLEPRAEKGQVLEAIQGHVLAMGELIGTFQR